MSLLKDETLDERTSLLPDKVPELLEMCLRTIYFSYGEGFYERREGAAMGCAVSAIKANLYMEFFKQLALELAPTRPGLWKQYVDDTCCIMKKGTVDKLLDHLNGVRPTMKFTVELEKDRTLSFLDTLLQRKHMAARTSLSTGNPCTLTGTCTLIPTTQFIPRRGWSDASMTEPGTLSFPRRTYEKGRTTWL